MSPDISMCQAEDCPLKEKCHRYTAIPFRVGQSYIVGTLYKYGKCEQFWDNKDWGGR